MACVSTPHGELALPAFLPDATRAVVRSLDSRDLEACGVPGLVVNAFHLARRPGSRVTAALGGVHRVMDWRRPVVTDSGGFQIYSLIRQNPRHGSITNKHVVFRVGGRGKAERLSPEKSVQIQLRLGADILICLDDCTHPDDPSAEQAASVDRTIAWARRCKHEFDRGLAARGRQPRGRHTPGAASGEEGTVTVSRETVTDQRPPGSDGRGQQAEAPCAPGAASREERTVTVSRETVTDQMASESPAEGAAAGIAAGRGAEAARPLLFAVVQGGGDAGLRRRCAEALVGIGFDGYCFGGWPFDSEGRFLADTLALTAELLPDERPKYAMGIGNPASLIACVGMGYGLFDCALPTRDARRGRLYAFRSARADDLTFERVYIRDARQRREAGPVSAACDCLCCRTYTRAYLHHLFAIGDSLAWRLATLHNLRFYSMLTARLRRDAEANL